MLLADRLMASEELAKYMLELSEAAYKSGHQDGYAEGKVFTLENKPDNDFELFKEDCTGTYREKRKAFGLLKIGILKAIEKLSRKGVAVDVLRKA
ncbi:hypothetical protein HanRHA438_Chr06g0282611 [Helianthus annuus]|uniref:Uncharacterized protein n=1 Tax=Helianthus annuus TaxID=4232 RepID=A0A9K3NL32_HELAN|nr:hypothetical protein HanXRQr2_Chr06g0273631 [Helianthus annuus]KAJ0561551.1 hypothetical protein HanHA300_Chr06g0224221 [Helianthus annuus]KAJ0568244.1 hypothetical protein HanIR_Chr06g0293971 [Helianthus annuus]KAJ0574616.1 hypothetical protein HanHA89_Chr06g0240181 [Helianthus annuus]KAJ0738947.1 hypothetical protein HanLR1_Chr06g0224081 [Helianthus annuus]